jgi:hypothetical protein
MSAILPTTNLDPRFEAARKHADTARKGLRLTVASCVALGLELTRLKQEIGSVHGGARRSSSDNPNLKWPELVSRETGFSYDRCNDFIKAAKAVRERISSSRKKGEKEIKMIVQAPPSQWTDDDYEQFSQHVEDAFQADTFKSLMLDLGFGPRLAGKSESKGKHVAEQMEFEFVQMMNAHDCVAEPIVSLHMTQLNPDAFVRHLYALPIDDIAADPERNRPKINGLRTLSTILSLASDEIARTIKAKGKRPITLPG